MNIITEAVVEYFEKRGLKFPGAWQALAFATTEQAEVYEILLGREGGWVRNNPGDKPGWDADKYAEELGDMIMMAVVAGLAEGVDPVAALVSKMDRKLAQLNLN